MATNIGSKRIFWIYQIQEIGGNEKFFEWKFAQELIGRRDRIASYYGFHNIMMDPFLKIVETNEEIITQTDQLGYSLPSIESEIIQLQFDLQEMELSGSSNSANSSHSRETPKNKEKKKRRTDEARDIRKYARYDPLMMAIKSQANHDKQIQEKVKAKIKNERSYAAYFLWVKYLLMKSKIDLVSFKQEVLENVKHKYGNRNKIFHEELRTEMAIMIRATELFMEGQGEEGIRLAYIREKEVKSLHKTAIHYMNECMEMVFEKSTIQELDEKVNNN